MKKFSFNKMSGAGNDFVLFDVKNNSDLNLHANMIRHLCDRKFGIGADGVILINDHPEYDFLMEYYNSDGSVGSLCGNGARCALKYSHESKRFTSNTASFFCGGEVFTGDIIDSETVKFYLNEPKSERLDLSLNCDGQNIIYSFIDTGSPHVVIDAKNVVANAEQKDSYYENIEDLPVFELGKKIRNNELFPLGTNVNFVIVKNNKILIRTYERGVEDETLACGTGSVAAVLIEFMKNNVQPPVKVQTRSGDFLTVDFIYRNSKFSNISLTGPAKIIFTGEIVV